MTVYLILCCLIVLPFFIFLNRIGLNPYYALWLFIPFALPFLLRFVAQAHWPNEIVQDDSKVS